MSEKMATKVRNQMTKIWGNFNVIDVKKRILGVTIALVTSLENFVMGHFEG